MTTKAKTFNASSSNFGAKGWIMVGYAFLVFFVNCLVGNGWQIAATYWEQSFGWNSAALISANSYGQVISVFTGLIIGRLMIKKVDAKVFSVIFGAVTVAAVALISYSPSYALAVALVIIASCAVQNWAYSINPVFLANWFPRKKGLVMGWATIGIPLGAGFSSKIINFVTVRSNINMGMIVIALFGVICIVTTLVFVTTDPTKRGYNPDNDQSMTLDEVKKMAAEEQAIADASPWTLKRVLGTKVMWLLAIPLGIEQLMSSGSMMTMVPRLLASGYEINMATNMILAAALIACPCSFIMGVVDSKIGPRKANIIVIIVGILSSLFMMSTALPMLILAVICLGVVVGGAANFATSVVVEYWGRANFTRVYSILSPVSFLIGGFGSAFTMGVAGAAGGNYNAVSVAFAVLLAVALVMYIVIRPGFVEKREAAFSR